MRGKLQNHVVSLVESILTAKRVKTPAWLMRPGMVQCGELWPHVLETYRTLMGTVLPDLMPERERREVDAVLIVEDRPPLILEVDEEQHFNTFRASTLSLYGPEHRVAFPVDVWRQRSELKTKLEGGGFGAAKPPLFDGEHGRHKQRAFRDMLCDLLPVHHGFGPTLRIAHFEVEDWIWGSKAKERMTALLKARLGWHGTPAGPANP